MTELDNGITYINAPDDRRRGAPALRRRKADRQRPPRGRLGGLRVLLGDEGRLRRLLGRAPARPDRQLRRGAVLRSSRAGDGAPCPVAGHRSDPLWRREPRPAIISPGSAQERAIRRRVRCLSPHHGSASEAAAPNGTHCARGAGVRTPRATGTGSDLTRACRYGHLGSGRESRSASVQEGPKEGRDEGKTDRRPAGLGVPRELGLGMGQVDPDRIRPVPRDPGLPRRGVPDPDGKHGEHAPRR